MNVTRQTNARPSSSLLQCRVHIVHIVHFFSRVHTYIYVHTYTHCLLPASFSLCLLFVFPFSLSLSLSLCLCLSLFLTLPSSPLLLSIVERLSRNVVHALYRRFVVNVRCSFVRSLFIACVTCRLARSSESPNPSGSFRWSGSVDDRTAKVFLDFRSVTRTQRERERQASLFVIVYQPFRLLSPFPPPLFPPSTRFRSTETRFPYPILHLPSFLSSLPYRFILHSLPPPPPPLYFLHLPQIRSLLPAPLSYFYSSCAGKENEYFMETDRYWGVHYRYCPALRIDLKEGRKGTVPKEQDRIARPKEPSLRSSLPSRASIFPPIEFEISRGSNNSIMLLCWSPVKKMIR